MWRCLTGRHTKVNLSFLVVGHTKFAPDWCFGLLKRLFRRTKVGSLSDIARITNESATCNFPQLVTLEDGTNVVPMLDWTSFFAPRMKKITGIKKLNHFHFNSAKPGVITVKEHSDTPEHEIKILKDTEPWSPNDLPSVILPKGLSAERQWYLFDQIQPFCPDAAKDVTCPMPTVPKPSSRANTPTPPSSPTLDGTLPSVPPPKKRRLCGICREEGHNARSCTKRVEQ